MVCNSQGDLNVVFGVFFGSVFAVFLLCFTVVNSADKIDSLLSPAASPRNSESEIS